MTLPDGLARSTFESLSPGDLFLPINVAGPTLTCLWNLASPVASVGGRAQRDVGFLCKGSIGRVTVPLGTAVAVPT